MKFELNVAQIDSILVEGFALLDNVYKFPQGWLNECLQVEDVPSLYLRRIEFKIFLSYPVAKESEDLKFLFENKAECFLYKGVGLPSPESDRGKQLNQVWMELFKGKDCPFRWKTFEESKRLMAVAEDDIQTSLRAIRFWREAQELCRLEEEIGEKESSLSSLQEEIALLKVRRGRIDLTL